MKEQEGIKNEKMLNVVKPESHYNPLRLLRGLIHISEDGVSSM